MQYSSYKYVRSATKLFKHVLVYSITERIKILKSFHTQKMESRHYRVICSHKSCYRYGHQHLCMGEHVCAQACVYSGDVSAHLLL